MANALGLLLMGIFGSWLVGRIERNVKAFFICLAAMLAGFVAGATISKVANPVTEDNTTAFVMIDNTEKGESIPMLCVMEPSLVRKPITSYSSITSKGNSCVDNLYPITPGVQTAHPIRCLSPPNSSVYSGYLIPIDCDTS